MRGYRFASESGYPSPWGIAAAMVLVGLFVWTAPMVEIKPLAFFQAVYAVAVFAAHFFLMPDWGFLRKLLQELGEMFEMAFLATMLALLLSLPLGFLAARNSVSNALVFQSTRGVLVLLRSLPDVILALAFVAVLGLGALPGVLAITLSSVGFMARFFADSIEVTDVKAVESANAAGASRMQMRLFVLLPQSLPDFISTAFYTFDSSLRSATILSIVGAGGIGYDLQVSMRLFEYPRVLLILLGVYISIALADWLSAVARRWVT